VDVIVSVNAGVDPSDAKMQSSELPEGEGCGPKRKQRLADELAEAQRLNLRLRTYLNKSLATLPQCARCAVYDEFGRGEAVQAAVSGMATPAPPAPPSHAGAEADGDGDETLYDDTCLTALEQDLLAGSDQDAVANIDITLPVHRAGPAHNRACAHAATVPPAQLREALQEIQDLRALCDRLAVDARKQAAAERKLRAACSRSADAAQASKRDIARLEAELGRSVADVAARDKKVSSLRKLLQLREQRLDELEQRVRAEDAQATAESTAMDALREKAKQAQDQARRKEASLRALRERVAEADRRVREHEEAVGAAHTLAAQASEKTKRLEGDVKSKEAQLAALRETVAKLLDRLEGELDADGHYAARKLQENVPGASDTTSGPPLRGRLERLDERATALQADLQRSTKRLRSLQLENRLLQSRGPLLRPLSAKSLFFVYSNLSSSISGTFQQNGKLAAIVSRAQRLGQAFSSLAAVPRGRVRARRPPRRRGARRRAGRRGSRAGHPAAPRPAAGGGVAPEHVPALRQRHPRC
jgi:hypothetical protein